MKSSSKIGKPGKIRRCKECRNNSTNMKDSYQAKSKIFCCFIKNNSLLKALRISKMIFGYQAMKCTEALMKICE